MPVARPALAGAAAALSGFSALVYEVAFTRLLAAVIGPTTYAFATMAASFITGIALGSAVGTRLSRRVSQPVLWLAAALMLTAVSASLVASSAQAVGGREAVGTRPAWPVSAPPFSAFSADFHSAIERVDPRSIPPRWHNSQACHAMRARARDRAARTLVGTGLDMTSRRHETSVAGLERRRNWSCGARASFSGRPWWHWSRRH